MKNKEKEKKEMAEEIWLHYYNQILCAAGLISEAQRNRMTHMINARALSTGDRSRGSR